MTPFRTVEFSEPAPESGGLRHVTVKSPALGRRADLTLYVPDEARGRAAELPVVILLHGVYGSHWAWALKGGAHRTAAGMIAAGEIPPMILAMPSDGLWGDGSGYMAHKSGADYERWIVDEVPAAVRLAIGVGGDPPSAPASCFISGLSMGGYGALRLAALYPGRFRAVSAHSAITKLAGIADFIEEPLADFAPAPGTEDVIDCVASNYERMGPIRFDCGLDDPLLAANRELHDELTRLEIDHTYDEFPGGHEWPYWAEHIRGTLLFFRKSLP